jgi:hypothetical protein
MSFALSFFALVNLYLVAGAVLFIVPVASKSKEESDAVMRLFGSPRKRVALGLFGLPLAGLLLAFPADGILVFGDLVPAAAILLESLILLSSYARLGRYVDKKAMGRAMNLLDLLYFPLGLGFFGVAILHIFFPLVPFL